MSVHPVSSPVLAGAALVHEPADLVPVLPALRGLLPGLRRGQVVAIDGAAMVLLALLAGASAAGAWCAVVGVPDFGAQAAADLGVELDRVVLVPEPGGQWAEAVAALLGAVEVVLVRPPGRVPGAVARRLVAMARRHASALVVSGDWEGAHARVRVAASQWTGPSSGGSYLRGRRVRLEVNGKGAGGRPRSAWVWLPGPDGAIAPADLEVAGPVQLGVAG